MVPLAGWRNIITLSRYWLKGRLSRAAMLWLLFGEGFAILFIAFGNQIITEFSSRFGGGGGGGFSDFALSLILSFILVGLLQSGFSGSGLPVTSADVDYVFTSPVRPREIFGAKVLINSLTTVLFSFPPLLFLFVTQAQNYRTPLWSAFPAGLATLLFLVTGLILSADVTISLGSSIAPRLRVLRNVLVFGVAALGFLPVILLIPSTPSWLGPVSQILPSGLAAGLSIGLVSGAPWSLVFDFDAAALLAWFAASLLIGIAMSRSHFYEVLTVTDALDSSPGQAGGKTTGSLQTSGKSVWSVVRSKESLVMKRSKERRGLLVSSVFLSGLMVIYSLAGAFQSSPTSFLFILFLVGSFGSGNASGWLEKERLWIVRTSALDVRRYLKEVYLARAGLLLLFLTPATVAVGIPLAAGSLGQPGSFAVLLALPAALEVAAVMMGGGMYFACRYGQSTADDILSSQAQQLTDVKRFLFQTVVNLVLVSPIMGLVLLSAATPVSVPIPPGVLAAFLLVAAGAYTYVVISKLLGSSGTWIEKREDL